MYNLCQALIAINRRRYFKLILTGCFALMFIVSSGCRQSHTQSEIDINAIIADTTVVNVLYFRIKQRCEACNAVADVSRKTVETAYADNDKVRYVEIETNQKANEPLVEKYEVAWNALLIVKGDNITDITQRAFLNAVKNSQRLENLIISEIDKLILKNSEVDKTRFR